jgi:hypothetical protein
LLVKRDAACFTSLDNFFTSMANPNQFLPLRPNSTGAPADGRQQQPQQQSWPQLLQPHTMLPAMNSNNGGFNNFPGHQFAGLPQQAQPPQQQQQFHQAQTVAPSAIIASAPPSANPDSKVDDAKYKQRLDETVQESQVVEKV